MSQKTIANFFSFVIILIVCGLIFSGCQLAVSNDGRRQKSNEKRSPDYLAPQTVGRIESPEIKESSGLAVSPCQPNVFWTHNDSDDGPFIYAFDGRGQKLGTWRLPEVKNGDWEDMAAFKDASGQCFLYLGDIGNNERVKTEFTIYRVREPLVTESAAASSKKNPLPTEPAEAIKGEYPDMRHDAETLMVHPATGDIYVLSKRISGAAGVYRIAAGYALDKTNRAQKIADVSVPAIPDGLLTGGDISPDGRRVILCDYFDAYELVLPDGAHNFDEIWKQEPKVVALGKREQGEAVAYAPDNRSIYATSEKRNQPLIQVKRK